MSYSNYRSYLNKRVNKVNCCCEQGPQGPPGIDGIDRSNRNDWGPQGIPGFSTATGATGSYWISTRNGPMMRALPGSTGMVAVLDQRAHPGTDS